MLPCNMIHLYMLHLLEGYQVFTVYIYIFLNNIILLVEGIEKHVVEK